MKDREQAPVVIIGTARSGTNMLRNVLSSLSGFVTWPCDEIPYIWRYGNRDHPNDEFQPELARPEVCAYINRAFERIRTDHSQTVIEKTCANSLRVGFVDRVLPEARFLVISRDGYDTIASAMKRWTSGFDLRYSMAKARYIPAGDIPAYGFRYLRNRLKQIGSPEKRLPVWGPVFEDMLSLPKTVSVAEMAALQWKRCIEKTNLDLAGISRERFLRLTYEDFVADPERHVERILDFLCMTMPADAIHAAISDVHSSSVGKAFSTLPAEDRKVIAEIVSSVDVTHHQSEQSC